MTVSISMVSSVDLVGELTLAGDTGLILRPLVAKNLLILSDAEDIADRCLYKCLFWELLGLVRPERTFTLEL